MCGICGYINSNETIEKSVVEKMNERLLHRGPDFGATWFSENEKVGLGHRRLSIIDIDERANQPFFSADERFVIVFNGEIYNYQGLKNELKDYPFKTNSDTEVILAAFIKWGATSLDKFNGMFAFAVYDKQAEKLFLARDRMGIKPLYYSLDDNYFTFASEIRPLIHSGIFKPKINQVALQSFVQYQTIPAPQTIIAQIKMLLPGHLAVYEKGNFSIMQWWKPKKQNELPDDKNELHKIIKEQLFQSVDKRMISDVPLGAFLSGGIDSSAVVGIMSELSAQKIDTFSVVFGEKKYSEAKYAQLVAQKFNTNHHEIEISPNEFLDDIPTALSEMDFPTVDGINSWMVSRTTKNAGITVALSGLGSDEIFAGYPHFKRIYKLRQQELLQKMPAFLKQAAGNIINTLKQNIAGDKLNDLLHLNNWNTADLYLLMRSIYSKNNANTFFNFDAENDAVSNDLANYFWKEKNHILADVSLSELNFYLPDILLRDTDQMSMAHALEVRVPFLDHHLVETVLSADDKTKFPHSPKQLLVESLGNLLPDKIVNRSKMGFLFPWDNWLRDELKDFAGEKITAFSKRNFVNEQEIIKVWDNFLNGDKHYNWARVWCFVVLENWLEENNIE